MRHDVSGWRRSYSFGLKMLVRNLPRPSLLSFCSPHRASPIAWWSQWPNCEYQKWNWVRPSFEQLDRSLRFPPISTFIQVIVEHMAGQNFTYEWCDYWYGQFRVTSPKSQFTSRPSGIFAGEIGERNVEREFFIFSFSKQNNKTNLRLKCERDGKLRGEP